MTVFFVGGAPRSGTTLLSAVLSGDDSTNPLLGEAKYFRLMIEAYRAGKANFDALTKYYFADATAFREFHRSWVLAFLDEVLAQYRPATNLVIKEPILTHAFPLVFELVEDAKFLIMVRDPRDIVASLAEVRERALRAQRHDLPMPQNASEAVKQLKAIYHANLACQRAGFAERVLYVKYESLVRAPAPEVERLRRFTGLALAAFDAGSAWPHSATFLADPIRARSPWTSSLWGKPVTATRIGRHREVLSAEDSAMIEAECAVIFRRFDYTTGARE